MGVVNTTIWVLDEKELRRVVMIGFLAPWAQKRDYIVRGAASVEDILEIKSRLGVEPGMRETCVWNAGAQGLALPSIARTVNEIQEKMPNSTLVIVTESGAKSDIAIAVDLGVSGIIPIDTPPATALSALDFILDGGAYFPHVMRHTEAEIMKSDGAPDRPVRADKPNEHDRDQSAAIARRAGARDAGPFKLNAEVQKALTLESPALTPRQRDVLSSLKVGKSNKEIARLLNLSESTVKIHVRQIMLKMGARNRTQVALMASQGRQFLGQRH